MGFRRSKRQFQISKRPTKKIKEALAFSKAELARKPRQIFFSRFVRTCHMQPLHSTELRFRRGNSRYRSFAEITASLSKRRFQPSVFPDVSTSVTCRVCFAEITGNLSKISGKVENT
ncbi:hypothetical protein ACFX13_038687 [Malus domestica]